MPTYNRRKFIPQAIRYFLRQEYENKELIIIDDGTDAIEDLVPQNPHIIYYRLGTKISLGAKLNMACAYAKGEIIANWDDDDWYAERRLSYQVDELIGQEKYICGLNRLLYYDLNQRYAYQYIYPANEKVWLLGSSLCYDKRYWAKNKYADIDVGMDALFVWGTSPARVAALADHTIAVHTIHDQNISPKNTDNAWWHRYPAEELEKLMANDWDWYNASDIVEPQPERIEYAVKASVVKEEALKNIYVCLVHENEQCIADLIRNLRYHDPASPAILYNGSGNTRLISGDFPFEQYGTVIHPAPRLAKHGYLFEHALECMRFALENFSFDILTIVDSDQLALRSGYPDLMGQFFANRPNIGMLSCKPERIDQANQEVWTAIQAFREYDLWKPFLRKFDGGESKFVHWTFWPSSVFTRDAISDLIKLHQKDSQLRSILSKTEIWATEEIIIPTLISLLGYEIAKNPTSYDYVQYKSAYTVENMETAFNRRDVYWAHPVSRKYEDPVRKYARERSGHYLPSDNKNHNLNTRSELMLTVPLLNKVKETEGWLSENEADLLLSVTLKSCTGLPPPHHIVEIGSYKGKSTILFGSVVKAYFPAAKVYAIDPHEGMVGAADEGIQSIGPSLEAFRRNISDAGIADAVELIRDYSYQVAWERPITLLFIDGLHDYFNVARDFWHFAEYIVDGGYIAFHDYADYYPGVMAFVDEILQKGDYQKVQLEDSMMVIRKKYSVCSLKISC